MDDCINIDLLQGQTESLKHLFESDIDEHTIDINQLLNESPYIDPCNPPNTNGKLTLMSLNCQSINSKISNLHTLIEQCLTNECHFDIIGLQETWLSESNYHGPNLAIEGYHFIHANKRLTSHGGLGFYINSDLEYIVRHDLDMQSNVFESLCIEITNLKERM